MNLDLIVVTNPTTVRPEGPQAGSLRYTDEPMTTPEWLTPGALERAWEHVRGNGGCAGADGVTLDRFAHDVGTALDLLRADVENQRYRPLPLLPIVVRKKPGSSATRTLLVPAVRDRVLQTAAGHFLGRAFEDDFLECSFAYRPHRSVNSAIARIRYLHEHGFTWVAEADIESFFDRVDHALLRERLESRLPDPRLRSLLNLWIECVRWDGHRTRPIGAIMVVSSLCGMPAKTALQIRTAREGYAIERRLLHSRICVGVDTTNHNNSGLAPPQGDKSVCLDSSYNQDDQR